MGLEKCIKDKPLSTYGGNIFHNHHKATPTLWSSSEIKFYFSKKVYLNFPKLFLQTVISIRCNNYKLIVENNLSIPIATPEQFGRPSFISFKNSSSTNEVFFDILSLLYNSVLNRSRYSLAV